MAVMLDFEIKEETLSLDFDEEQATTPLEVEEIQQVATADHSKLANRDKPDQHPIEAITDLEEKLEEASADPNTMTNLEIEQLWNQIMN